MFPQTMIWERTSHYGEEHYVEPESSTRRCQYHPCPSENQTNEEKKAGNSSIKCLANASCVLDAFGTFLLLIFFIVLKELFGAWSDHCNFPPCSTHWTGNLSRFQYPFSLPVESQIIKLIIITRSLQRAHLANLQSQKNLASFFGFLTGSARLPVFLRRKKKQKELIPVYEDVSKYHDIYSIIIRFIYPQCNN